MFLLGWQIALLFRSGHAAIHQRRRAMIWVLVLATANAHELHAHSCLLCEYEQCLLARAWLLSLDDSQAAEYALPLAPHHLHILKHMQTPTTCSSSEALAVQGTWGVRCLVKLESSFRTRRFIPFNLSLCCSKESRICQGLNKYSQTSEYSLGFSPRPLLLH